MGTRKWNDLLREMFGEPVKELKRWHIKFRDPADPDDHDEEWTTIVVADSAQHARAQVLKSHPQARILLVKPYREG